MPLQGAFTVLLPLCLLIGVSAGTVPSPTNLTVSCDNTNVVASWKYSQQQSHTRFKVHIKGHAGEYFNETTAHRYDLSPFIWESRSHYMEVNYVTVTAIQGSEQSEPVQSNTFTFNEFKSAHIICKLLFPPVDLKVDDFKGSLTFLNPLDFYPELQQERESDAVVFKFTVTTKDHENFPGQCSASQKHCERDEISFPKDDEQCVTLTGSLWCGNGVPELVFNKTDLICPDTESYVYVIVLVVLLLVTFIIVSIIVVWIYLTKSWTFRREEPTVPDILKWVPKPSSTMPFLTMEKEVCSSIKEIKGGLNKRNSVSSEEDDLLPRRDGPKVHCCEEGIDPYGDGRLLENSSQLPEPRYEKRGNDLEDSSVNTEFSTVSSEEEEEKALSPYDSPQNLMLCSSGDGRTVEGQHREDDELS